MLWKAHGYWLARHELKSVEQQIKSLYNLLMEMTKTSAGKLRAIGYDAKTRTLRVELDDGNALEYAGVSEDLWHRLKSAGSQWSFYRDNIEEELTAKRVSAKPSSGGKNPLDDLFK